MRLPAFALAIVSIPCLAAAAPPASPQRLPPARVEQKAIEWTAAAWAHEAGEADAPLQAIASWPREHVDAAVGQQLAQLRRLRERANGAPTAELRTLAALLTRGLSLHTDIAFVERDALAERPSAGGRAAILLRDGEEVKRVARSHHWIVARRIATGLTAVEDRRAPVLAWYRTIANGLQQLGDYDIAEVHLNEGLAAFPDDPLLRLYQGTLFQAMGDPRLGPYVGGVRGGGLRVRRLTGAERPDWVRALGLRYVPPPARMQLEAAAREFRRALDADPALHEARIRLAHVLGTLGEDREAADTVRPALDAPLPPFLEFYAAMVLGRSEEHLGRYREAGVAYTRAADRFPAAPSARIGRSRAALADGRAADALAAIDDVGRHEIEEDGDPWLRYLRWHEPAGAAMFDAWRASLPARDGR